MRNKHYFNDNTHDIRYRDLEVDKKYAFLLVNFNDHAEEKYWNTTYYFFNAMVGKDYPELTAKQGMKTIISLPDKSFVAGWRRYLGSRKMKLDIDNIENVYIIIEKKKNRRLNFHKIKLVSHDELIDVLDESTN